MTTTTTTREATTGAPAPLPVDTGDAAPDAQRVTREQATLAAIALLRSGRNAVLGTLSRRDEGAPFGSVAPYALDRSGAPLLFMAGIAEHTRNLQADPRISLTVHDAVGPEEDIQTKARLCVMGRASQLADPEAEAEAWARYRARLPAASGYRRTHDFALWRVEPLRMRWIGGFGEIFWLRVEDFRADAEADPFGAGAAGIVAHMNEDHVDAIQDFYRAELGERPERPRMVGVDAYGMDFDAEGAGRLRVDFARRSGPETVRRDVVEALGRARARLRESTTT